MGAKTGLDCKLFRNTGTSGTPVWNEITDARDVTLNLTAGDADASSRGVTFKQYLMTLLDASIDFELVYNTATDDFAALQAAFFNRTTIPFAIMDGPVSAGSEGLLVTCYVSKFTRNEPLENTVTVSVSLKPAYGTTPSWYEPV
jgi:hypothetical protein